jgi:hypothetical protein
MEKLYGKNGATLEVGASLASSMEDRNSLIGSFGKALTATNLDSRKIPNFRPVALKLEFSLDIMIFLREAAISGE